MNVLWELNLVATSVDMVGRHLQLVTVEFAIELEWFVLGNANCPLLETSNQCIWVKNTLGWRAVTFNVCWIIQLFCVAFCVVRAVHKFDFWLVSDETPYKLWPGERRSCVNRDSCFWQDLYVFSQLFLLLLSNVPMLCRLAALSCVKDVTLLNLTEESTFNY